MIALLLYFGLFLIVSSCYSSSLLSDINSQAERQTNPDVQARGAYRQRTPSLCDVKDSLSLRLLGSVVESWG